MSNVIKLEDRPLVSTPPKPRERVIPHSLDTEQALLGALLINNDLYAGVSSIVTADSFHEPIHQKIYGCMVPLIEAGKAADPITLRNFLGDVDLGSGMTTKAYLARLAAEATAPRNAVGYARVIRDLHARRRLIAIADDAVALACDSPPESTVEGMLNEMEDQLGELRPMAGGRDGFVSFESASNRMLDAANVAYMNDATVAGGVSTGLPKLDNAIGGLYPGDFLVVAGRPGSGKSALGVNIAHDISERGGTVAFFSLEMPAAQLVGRIGGDIAGIPYSRIRKGRISEEEFSRLIDETRERASKRLWIDENGRLSIAQIAMRSRMLKKRHGLAVIIVDYLQLVSGVDRRKDSRHLEVGEVTAGLKALAKELEVPVIALAQLSRNVEMRDNKRPQLQDLRESGSTENDADIVAGIYREEYYLMMNKPRDGASGLADWEERMARWRGVAEISILKQRNGPPSTIMVGFISDLMRFVNESPWDVDQVSHDSPTRGAFSPRQKRFTKGAAALRDVIRSLTLNGHAMPAELWMRCLHTNARVVTHVDALDRWRMETIFAGDDESCRKKFREAFLDLRAGDVAFACGDAERPFVYLPELVAKQQ